MGKILWNNIINYLGDEGKDIKIFAISRPSKLHFNAIVKDNKIIVNKSKILEPTSNINTPRIISYNKFIEIYNLYDRYINNEKGIREKITKISTNSSYIISLIHNVK